MDTSGLNLFCFPVPTSHCPDCPILSLPNEKLPKPDCKQLMCCSSCQGLCLKLCSSALWLQPKIFLHKEFPLLNLCLIRTGYKQPYNDLLAHSRWLGTYPQKRQCMGWQKSALQTAGTQLSSLRLRSSMTFTTATQVGKRTLLESSLELTFCSQKADSRLLDNITSPLSSSCNERLQGKHG